MYIYRDYTPQELRQMICMKRLEDKSRYFPMHFRCRWCENCIKVDRQKLKDKLIEADYTTHWVLTVVDKKAEYEIERWLYERLLDMLVMFKNELRKELKTKWEFWAIPHVEYKPNQRKWNPHVHILTRGIDVSDKKILQRVWRKTKCHNEMYSVLYGTCEGALIKVNRVMGEGGEDVQKHIEARYVVNKYRLMNMGKKTRLYRMTGGFYLKKEKSTKGEREINHNEADALLRLSAAFKKLLKTGEKKRITTSVLMKILACKTEGRIYKRINRLVEEGFLTREKEESYKKGYVYSLNDSSEYSDYLIKLFEYKRTKKRKKK